jgi:hypothetical protein
MRKEAGVSFPGVSLVPPGYRVVRRLPPIGAVAMPRAVAVGICDVSVVAGPEPPRILCDERGQLYEWRAEQLRPLPPHELPGAMIAEPAAGLRPLFADPGYPLVVRWNDFRSLLAAQIAHPERLRDGHRVGVHAQVYEVTTPQPLSALAESILGDSSKAGELAILTDTLASLLGLSGRVPPRAPRHDLRPDDDVIMSNERIVRLLLTTDPTSDPSPAASPNEPRGEKDSIPQIFVRPWEFKTSREEVLYELTCRGGVLRTARSWVAKARALIGGRGEHRRWAALRAGKNLDEQLWTVRPPTGGLEDPAVRRWAERTLSQAGYNVPAMLFEWEIFWRRKLA